MHRRFYLLRKIDISGVSGCGRVAEGILFSSGICVLNWLGSLSSTEVSESLDTMLAIHGHEGATTVEWVDCIDEVSEESLRVVA